MKLPTRVFSFSIVHLYILFNHVRRLNNVESWDEVKWKRKQKGQSEPVETKFKVAAVFGGGQTETQKSPKTDLKAGSRSQSYGGKVPFGGAAVFPSGRWRYCRQKNHITLKVFFFS